MNRDILYRELQEMQLTADHENAPTTLKMRSGSTPPVMARILWPALGFPAVICPDKKSLKTPMSEGDATKCICVLLLSNKKILSKADASRYLRWVPWDIRRTHFIESGKPGSFAETAIEVRNEISGRKFALPGWKDLHGEGITFGGDKEGENHVTVKLADYVRKFYNKNGLAYLHEIRIWESASAQLPKGQYQLFWNKENGNLSKPSEEMKLLLEKHAQPLRERNAWQWEKSSKFLMDEYKYEFGDMHAPYKSELRPKTFTEVLHPLFVTETPAERIRIGHITDTHVDVRADVYEHNLNKLDPRMLGDEFVNEYNKAGKKIDYNNWNKNLVKLYEDAKKTSDILLLTGDLVDYGRGHAGIPYAQRLGEDDLYHTDRNWFLLYYLLASGNSYKKPVYSILGNHDWRLNPYPPFAIAGAPGPASFFNNHSSYQNASLKKLLETAHGPGIERKFTYHLQTDNDFIKKFWEDGKLLKTLGKLIAQRKTMDEPHLPVETTTESVGWYLLNINPFLDYKFSLPGKQQILMLDWAEDEDLFFPMVIDGKEWPFFLWEVKQATHPGPKARNSLSTVQRKLVESIVASEAPIKIIGIHTPPIGPYPDWTDEDLMKGKKIYGPGEKVRGPKKYATKKPDGTIIKWNGHPIFATLPDEEHYGAVADYGSFSKSHDWLINQLNKAVHPVHFILSGHIHRNGLYAVHKVSKNDKVGPLLEGRMLVKSIFPPPTSPKNKYQIISLQNLPYRFPVYINTTSAGPRGGFYARKSTPAEDQSGGITINPGYTRIEVSSKNKEHKVFFTAL